MEPTRPVLSSSLVIHCATFGNLKDVCRMAAVSRLWRSATALPLLWRGKSEHYFPTTVARVREAAGGAYEGDYRELSRERIEFMQRVATQNYRGVDWQLNEIPYAFDICGDRAVTFEASSELELGASLFIYPAYSQKSLRRHPIKGYMDSCGVRVLENSALLGVRQVFYSEDDQLTKSNHASTLHRFDLETGKASHFEIGRGVLDFDYSASNSSIVCSHGDATDRVAVTMETGYAFSLCDMRTLQSVRRWNPMVNGNPVTAERIKLCWPYAYGAAGIAGVLAFDVRMDAGPLAIYNVNPGGKPVRHVSVDVRDSCLVANVQRSNTPSSTGVWNLSNPNGCIRELEWNPVAHTFYGISSADAQFFDNMLIVSESERLKLWRWPDCTELATFTAHTLLVADPESGDDIAPVIDSFKMVGDSLYAANRFNSGIEVFDFTPLAAANNSPKRQKTAGSKTTAS